MKLTQEQLHDVREWLKMDRQHQPLSCPFSGRLPGWHHCQSVCPAIFKHLFEKRDNLEVFCPCKAYTHTYVVRKARLLLARKGEIK